MSKIQDILNNPPKKTDRYGINQLIDEVEWEKQILSAVEKMLPQPILGVRYDAHSNSEYYKHGWNQAIAEMRKRLKGEV